MTSTSYNLYYELQTNQLQLIRTIVRRSNSNHDQRIYQEYVVLQEQIGQVDSRLSERTIMDNLKITSYDATSKRMDEEADICVICQSEYEKNELIGGLQCRHEYHVECIKKWLKQHNSCPICKADAVSPSSNKFQKRK